MNYQIGHWVVQNDGFQNMHLWAEMYCDGLYSSDRVHLLQVGQDLLLNDWQKVF